MLCKRVNHLKQSPLKVISTLKSLRQVSHRPDGRCEYEERPVAARLDQGRVNDENVMTIYFVLAAETCDQIGWVPSMSCRLTPVRRTGAELVHVVFRIRESRQTSMAPTRKAAFLAVILGVVLGIGTCRGTDGSQHPAMISSKNFRCDERRLRVRPVQLRLETPFWGSSGAGLAASSDHPGWKVHPTSPCQIVPMSRETMVQP
jgi:hypothetical protein